MAKLNEGILYIEPGSTLDKLYNQLLAGMTQNAQEKLPDFSGDGYVSINPETNEFTADVDKINSEISQHSEIMRKNAAFILANSIVSCVSGGSGSNPPSSGYLSVHGGAMAGYLNALFNFKAGGNGATVLSVYQTTETDPKDRHNRVDVNGELHLGSRGLYLEDTQVMTRDKGILTVANNDLFAVAGDMSVTGVMRLGSLTLSQNGIQYNGVDFYHSGNANRNDVDWNAKNLGVNGDMSVTGNAEVLQKLTALGGADLGISGQVVLRLEELHATLFGELDIQNGGISVGGSRALYQKDKNTVVLSAVGKRLVLGADTPLVALQSPLVTEDGEYTMLSVSGDGYFPNSFKAEHASGGVVIRTYGETAGEQGVLFPKYVRFGNISGVGIHSGDARTLQFLFPSNSDRYRFMSMNSDASSSAYAPLDRQSESIFITTDADFYVFDKPVEGKTSIGITGAKTRLSADQLFFHDNACMVAVDSGIVLHGDGFVTGNVGSSVFSSGFAGNGWQIGIDRRTGNVHATFDTLTIRKQMRVYELEVRKTRAVNGDLWISSSCSGASVEEI